MFFGGRLIELGVVFHVFILIWSRSTLPRIRYDYFVSLMWRWCLVMFVLVLPFFLVFG